MHRKLACMVALSLALSAGAQPAAAPQQTRKHHVSKQDRALAQRDFMRGAKALDHGDARAAMNLFIEAAALNPNVRRYALSEDIARQHLVMDLIHQSDRQEIMGHFDQARTILEQARQLDPANPMVQQHEYQLANAKSAAQPAIQVQDALAGPIELKPTPGRRSFHMRGGERDVIQQVLKAYGIQPTIDDSVSAQAIPFDVDNVNFAQAQSALALATGTFLVPLDPARALVAKDTRDNRNKFDRVGEETIYLPGMSDQELTDMVTLAKTEFGIKTAVTTPSHSAITVQGPAGTLPALNTTLTNLVDARSELQLDVYMYEVDRTNARDLGVLLPNQSSVFNVYSEARNLLNSNSGLVQQIISSGLAAPGDWQAILAILIASGQVSNTILTQPFGVLGGGLTMTGFTTSGGTLNMNLNASDVHAIDKVRLRVLDREEGILRSGEKYPIETSNYSSLGASSSLNIPGISSAGLSSTLANLGVNLSSLTAAASQTIPQVQYQDIGLTLDVTPHIENQKMVSLKFNLKLSSLAGSAINGLPILNNRSFQSITTLAPGQSAVLVSMLSRSESQAITGMPGLSEIPGFTDATNNNSNLNYSRLAIVITPHIVRAARQETANRMILLPRNPAP